MIQEDRKSSQFSCSKSVGKVIHALKQLYKTRTQTTLEEKQIIALLRVRAWVIHLATNFWLILRILNGSSAWMEKNLLMSCFEELRVEEEQQSSTAADDDNSDDEKVDCLPFDFREDIVANMRPII